MKKLRVTIGNRTYDVTVEELDEGAALPVRPSPMASAPPPSATPAPASAPPPSPPTTTAGPGAVYSPMAGTVKSILVKVGDVVSSNQPLVILDAMKMENQIMAPTSGAVSSIAAREGQTVREGELLLVLN